MEMNETITYEANDNCYDQNDVKANLNKQRFKTITVSSNVILDHHINQSVNNNDSSFGLAHYY